MLISRLVAAEPTFWNWLSRHPAPLKRYEVVHSSPELAATHAAPKSTVPAAQRAFWAPLDRLIALARGGETLACDTPTLRHATFKRRASARAARCAPRPRRAGGWPATSTTPAATSPPSRRH